jgi:hypothetical protein
MLAATTDGDDLLSVIEIDTIDANGHAQDLRHKWDCEALLQHGEKSDALFGLAVGIDDRFFNEGLEFRLGSRVRECCPRR